MSAQSKTRVLFADDEPAETALYAKYFGSKSDIVPVTAVSAGEALTRLERSDIDCLVSDSVHTDDGESLVEAAKRKHPDLPVLLYSGGEPERLPTETADGYLRKGTKPETGSLLDTLRESVHRLVTEASTPGEELSTDWQHLGVFDWAHADCVSTTILAAFAERTGVDMTRATPLFETLDPDALDTLMKHSTADATSAEVSVQFPFEGYVVQLSSDGTVQYRT